MHAHLSTRPQLGVDENINLVVIASLADDGHADYFREEGGAAVPVSRARGFGGGVLLRLGIGL